MSIKFTQDLIKSSTGKPPIGCGYCDRGTKMVLYITGICARDCFYCPLSEVKKGNDVIFANERRIEGGCWMGQIFAEARSMKALGTGITGGDPMLFPDRTISVIRSLKEEFGSRHHIHLYTSGPFESGILQDVKEAGLNEIRFHPPIECWGGFRYLGAGSEAGDPGQAGVYHDLLSESRKVGLSTGFEIPSVPDPSIGDESFSEGLHDLLDYAARENLEFVNINELEASHTNAGDFKDRGYELIGISMAVSGSIDLAWRSVERVRKDNPGSRTVFHVCSSVYKDAVQLRNRIKRMAENLCKPYEVVTDDGTLIRGVIKSDEPAKVITFLSEDHDVPDDLMCRMDEDTVYTAPWILQEIGEELLWECYISEVYPTVDQLEVERIPL